ncbi:MAG: S-layer homology domain-containing protein [Oscillospiraceae bacterium]|nr:S-layer homology domain-containing protein [Oscillospiraceae bacterium]
MKKYRNICRMLSVLLVLAMLLPCIGMTANSADAPCAEDGCSGRYLGGICSAAGHFEAAPAEDGVYRISNAGQLYWFAALVNAGENEYDGDNGEVCNAVLTNDIVLNADMAAGEKLAWTPIGLYTSAREFVRYSGTFDGAGHTIYGLYYDNVKFDGRNAGLFGTVDTNGTVKNLTLADSIINGATDIGGIVSHNYGVVLGCTQSGTVTGTGAAGGIVCRNMGLVRNCTNTGAVTGSTTGGIAAENQGEVASCGNTGTVSGTNSVGGIVGMNSGTVDASVNSADVTAANTHVGGVVGNHIGGEITGSGNRGAVTGGSDYIGGVAGVCSGAAITRSFNTGAVTGSADKSDAVGGVVGAIDGTNTAASAVTSCYNTGAVTGRSWVGGLAGLSGYQKTPQAVSFSNSYSTGAVTGSSLVGAVIGSMSKGTVTGSYYLSGAAQNSVSGATAATAEQFASGEIAYLLNGSTSQGALIWKQNIGTDASPRFEGAVVYCDSETGTYYNEGCVHTPGAPVRENSREATCTEDGSYDTVVYCAACGEEISRQTTRVPALGHDWQGGVCSRCGATRNNPFVDVKEGDFFCESVLWAVEKGITAGMDETHFAPGSSCVRSQVVTFLWRAAGSPEPAGTSNPFEDVKQSDYFYKAVLWAVEQKITAGVDETHFAPYAQCSRAQAVAFLWRAVGSPEPSSSKNPFVDVAQTDFFFKAVLWAVENGITAGMDSTHFGPASSCNRAQVVTFLYRTYND